MWGPTCRFFSPQRVVEEVKFMIDKYGSKGIYFINDNFTIRKKETIELCELMKQEKLVYLWHHTGIYKIDDIYVGRIIKYYKRN